MKRILLGIVMAITVMAVPKIYGYEKLTGNVIVAEGSTEQISEDLIIDMVQYCAEKLGIKLVDKTECPIYTEIYVNVFYSGKHDIYAGYIRIGLYYKVEAQASSIGKLDDKTQYVRLSFGDTALIAKNKKDLKGIIIKHIYTSLEDYKKMDSEEKI